MGANDARVPLEQVTFNGMQRLSCFFQECRRTRAAASLAFFIVLHSTSITKCTFITFFI